MKKVTFYLEYLYELKTNGYKNIRICCVGIYFIGLTSCKLE